MGDDSGMVTLAIETSGMSGGVSLVDRGKVLAEIVLASRQTHSRRLMSSIVWLMDNAALHWKDIGLVCASLGPGSFTGLRIGLSTAKGIALARHIPIVGIPTLDALARHVTPCIGDVVCPVLDARKSQIYAALYRSSRDDSSIEKILAEGSFTPEKLPGLIPACDRVLLLGDGLVPYGDLLKRCLGDRAFFVPAHLSHVRAATIGVLGEETYSKSGPHDLNTLRPIYVRPSEAEERKTRTSC